MTTLSRGTPARINPKPWYREPWPWFLMSGPALVVVAGIATYVLAARTENALVVDNYYKEGLAINRVLDATRNAAAHGYQARVEWSQTGSAQVMLAGSGALPETLELRFVHPTHARFDQTVALLHAGEGRYLPASSRDDAAALLRGSPRWYVRLQDVPGTWRLAGEWDLRRESALSLTAETR